MKRITFNAELASNIKKDGTQNIFIRITQNRGHERVQLGYSVEKKFWNSEEQLVRKGHPMADMLNDYITLKISELERTLLKSKLQQKNISAKVLQQTMKNEVLGGNFFIFAKKVIARFLNVGTADAQLSVLRCLAEFYGSENLTFGEIDYDFLEDYKAHLKRKNLSTNTIWNKIKTLKARYNDAIKSGVWQIDRNPFDLVTTAKAKSKRVRLTEEQIMMIENFETITHSVRFHAKNLFMLCFLHWGVRISDMLMMKYKNIKEGRLVYIAKKTAESQKEFDIKIHPRAIKILQYYQDKPHSADDYIFPFLKRLPKKYTATELQREIKLKTAQVNNELADIASALDLPRFSSNTARHSFAEITKNKTGDKKAVTSAFGHSSEKVTENYFNSASKYQNDKLSEDVY